MFRLLVALALVAAALCAPAPAPAPVVVYPPVYQPPVYAHQPLYRVAHAPYVHQAPVAVSHVSTVLNPAPVLPAYRPVLPAALPALPASAFY